MKNKKIIIIAGPTAVGKTALSVSLAKRINGEIISADSMQIYKQMDIGTAKVTASESSGIVATTAALFGFDSVQCTIPACAGKKKKLSSEVSLSNTLPNPQKTWTWSLLSIITSTVPSLVKGVSTVNYFVNGA